MKVSVPHDRNAEAKRFVPVLRDSDLVMELINIAHDVFLIPNKGLASPGRSGFNISFMRSLAKCMQNVTVLSEKALCDCATKVRTSISSNGGKVYVKVNRQVPGFPACCWKEMSVNGVYRIILKCLVVIAKKKGVPFEDELLVYDDGALVNMFATMLSLGHVAISSNECSQGGCSSIIMHLPDSNSPRKNRK